MTTKHSVEAHMFEALCNLARVLCLPIIMTRDDEDFIQIAQGLQISQWLPLSNTFGRSALGIFQEKNGSFTARYVRPGIQLHEGKVLVTAKNKGEFIRACNSAVSSISLAANLKFPHLKRSHHK